MINTLLPNKSQETYTRLYNILKEKLGVIIKHFKSDYEIAQTNAVKSVFPQAKITGCYRHYNAAVWKKTEKKGILRTRNGRNVARITAVLALLPAEQIPAAWGYVLSIAPDSDEINKYRRYYESQWYPKMPPSMLSCAHQRHRTTNALEAWHRRINAGRIPKRPNFYMFLHKLRRESKYWDRKVTDNLFTHTKKNRQYKDVYFDSKYKKVLRQFERKELTLQQFTKKYIFLQMFK